MQKIIASRSGSLVRVTAEAPIGYTWNASGTHELVAESRGGKSATAECRKDIRERMAYGISPCDDSDCDWCKPV